LFADGEAGNQFRQLRLGRLLASERRSGRRCERDPAVGNQDAVTVGPLLVANDRGGWVEAIGQAQCGGAGPNQHRIAARQSQRPGQAGLEFGTSQQCEQRCGGGSSRDVVERRPPGRAQIGEQPRYSRQRRAVQPAERLLAGLLGDVQVQLITCRAPADAWRAVFGGPARLRLHGTINSATSCGSTDRVQRRSDAPAEFRLYTVIWGVSSPKA
jgi:hypothetical protein